MATILSALKSWRAQGHQRFTPVKVTNLIASTDDLFRGEVVGECSQPLGEGVDAPVFANEPACAGLDWADMGHLTISVK